MATSWDDFLDTSSNKTTSTPSSWDDFLKDTTTETTPSPAVQKAIETLPPTPTEQPKSNFFSDVVKNLESVFAPKKTTGMEFKVGEGMTPEQTAKAQEVISGKDIIPVGQTIKVPFTDAGVTVPSGGGIGAVYSAIKSAVEMPERAYRSVSESPELSKLFGVPNMNPDKNVSTYSIPSYAQVASMGTAESIDAGMPPVAAVILNSAAAGGEFAQDALWYSGLLESGASKAESAAAKITNEEQTAAHQFLGNPKTMEEARANYLKMQKEFHPDITGGNDTISKQANNAWKILQREGIPTKTTKGFGDLFKKKPVEADIKPEDIKQITDEFKAKTAPIAEEKAIIPKETSDITTKDNYLTAKFGEFEGKDQTSATDKVIHNNIENKPAEPMAPSGESFNDLYKRVITDGVAKDIQSIKENTGLVTHNSIYGLIKTWNEWGKVNYQDLSPEKQKQFRQDYIDQDNKNPPGSSHIIKGENGNIILGRHGMTDQNGSIYRTPEAQLTTEGKKDAEKLGETMKDNNVTNIISSPLNRTIETSNIVMDKVGGKEDVVKKGESSLITQAKKYKSAEEFVKAKTRNFGLPSRDVADEVYAQIYKGEKPIIRNISELNPTETRGTKALLGVKDTFGDIKAGRKVETPIIVTEKGTILDGHNRYYQAIANGDKTIPVFIDKPSSFTKSQLTDIWNKAQETPPTVPEPKPTQTSIELTSGINPGLDKFIEQDVKPKLKGIKETAVKSWDYIKKTLNPESRGLAAQKTASIMKEQLARMAFRKENTYHALENARKIFDRYTEQKSLDFIDNLETGKPNPKAEKFTETMRDALDSRYKQIQQIKGSEAYIENYFPHIWEDPNKAKNVLSSFMGKKPLAGSKSFLKQRTIPTIKEGIALGLKPVSYNPVDLIMAKVDDMDKFLMADATWNQFKDEGLRKYVATGQRAPDGWRQIDDPIAKAFQFSEAEKGLITRGKYYMPEEAATIVNNYLSPGLANNPIYNAFRMIGNTLNQAQLGLSAYHVMFTAIDAVTSEASLDWQKIFAEKMTPAERAGAGIRFLTTTPRSPYILWKNIVRGNKLLNDYFSKNPEIPQLVDALQRAGGRAKMDTFYKNSAVESFLKALRSGNKLGALTRAPSAAIEGLSKFIMEDIVPRQKLGVFSNMATHILEQAEKGNWSEYKTTLRLQEAWQSIDNRMGQLVYDNMFWNKALKDLGMASVRSLGWNIGSLQEIPGGLIDYAKLPAQAFTKKGRANARMTPKMAYTVSLPFVVGVLGGIIYYMYHGKAPSKLADYYAIPTNKYKPDGTQEKIMLASYMKDVYAYQNDPVQTAQNKLHPEIATIIDMLQNKDYFGTEIRNPNDPIVKQLTEVAKYQAKQFIPFSITNMIQREKAIGADVNWISFLQSFGGVTPAPGYLTKTPTQNAISNLYSQRFGGGIKSQETADIQQKKGEVKSLYRSGKTAEAQTALDKLVQEGIVKERGLSTFISQMDIPADIQMFKRLTAEDQKALIKKMDLVDVNKYAWFANKDLMQGFGKISQNADNWVTMVENGEVTKPEYSKGQIKNYQDYLNSIK